MPECGNISSSSGVFSYDETEMYATGYSGSSRGSPPSSNGRERPSTQVNSNGGGGRMKAGYQSLVDVINYRHTQGPAWLQNTIPKKPLLARSTSVLAKPNHMRA